MKQTNKTIDAALDDAVSMAKYLGCDQLETRESLSRIADHLHSFPKPVPTSAACPLAAFLPRRKG